MVAWEEDIFDWPIGYSTSTPSVSLLEVDALEFVDIPNVNKETVKGNLNIDS